MFIGMFENLELKRLGREGPGSLRQLEISANVPRAVPKPTIAHVSFTEASSVTIIVHLALDRSL